MFKSKIFFMLFLVIWSSFARAQKDVGDHSACRGILMGSNKKEALVELLKFDEIYFYKFGENKFSRPIVIIPGGPWISGEYLDEFSKSLSVATGHTVYRAIIPNHEVDFNGSHRNLNFSQLVKLLFKGIQTLSAEHEGVTPHGSQKYKMPLLIGHSFGSILSASLVADAELPVSGIILLNTLLSFDGWSRFQEKLLINNLLSSEDVLDDISFLKWWSKVLPMYFHKPPSSEVLHQLTKDSFMQQNTSQTAGAGDLSVMHTNLQYKLKKLNILAAVIQGDDDPIGPSENNLLLEKIYGSIFQSMKDCGHFPMFEAELELTTAVQYLIQKL